MISSFSCSVPPSQGDNPMESWNPLGIPYHTYIRPIYGRHLVIWWLLPSHPASYPTTDLTHSLLDLLTLTLTLTHTLTLPFYNGTP